MRIIITIIRSLEKHYILYDALSIAIKCNLFFPTARMHERFKWKKKTFSHVNFNGRAARIFSPIKLNRWCLRRRHRTIYNLHLLEYIWNMRCGNFLQHAFSCETITLHPNYTAHCSKCIWLHACNGCNSRSQLFFAFNFNFPYNCHCFFLPANKQLCSCAPYFSVVVLVQFGAK